MPSSNDLPSTSLKLLAPDGIIHVTFAGSLDADQSLTLMDAAQTAQSVDELARSLKVLGNAWRLRTTSVVINRKRTGAAS